VKILAIEPETELKVDFTHFDPDLVWNQYLTFEDEFVHYLRYVPLEEEHYNVYSMRLGDLLNNVGSIVDSFFNNAIYCDCLDDIQNINKFRQKKERKMRDHRQIFENYYNLSNKEIFVLKNFSKIAPFSNWNENKPLEWWKKYTLIKHDRFENRKQATLKTTLEALGALFLLNVIHLDTRGILIRDGIIPNVSINSTATGGREIFIEMLLKKEPLDGFVITYAKSRLFGYVFELKELKMTDNDKIGRLSPYNIRES
jgi:hypothetical protein